MEQRERLASLDAFRGFTIAGMILVNNPGTWSAIYPQLRHAEWDGWTFTDWIFPFFLFIVGVAMTISFARRKERGDDQRKLIIQVMRRSLIIFGLGLFLAGFPYFNLSTIRIPGVLQRIAVCYFISSLIVLRTGIRGQAYTIVGLLVLYWLMMKLIPVPEIGAGLMERGRNFSAYVDSLFLSGHMWSQTKTWDPEGIVSTIPAIATTLFGAMLGHYLHSTQHSKEEKTAWIFVAGSGMLLLGAVLDMWLPINKSIWTSSYSIFMAGWALVCFSIFYFLIDVKGYRKWVTPFIIYGMNAITVFFLSGIVGRLIASVIQLPQGDSGTISLQQYIFRMLYLPLASPINASLLYAITFVLVMFAVVWIMWKRKWFLKVG